MMAARRRHRVNLALQGGGVHGAFTWGVLDRLLEDERIEIEAISGSSAGALNAAVLAYGLIQGGRAGARDALRHFWSQVADRVAAGGSLVALFGDANVMGSPLGWYTDWLSRVLSPYQFNPLDLNPLRDILVDLIDFAQLRRGSVPRILVAATAVRTGRLRLFRRAELSAEALMASACLPTLFRAVHIAGEPYWDGGYVANPALMPLVEESPAHDLLLVQVNPWCRVALPTDVESIVDRVNEITFNASLVHELRTIAWLQRLMKMAEEVPHRPNESLFARLEALRLHRIDGQFALAELDAASHLQAAWPVVSRLHAIGRQAADQWLDRNAAHLGRRATLSADACECGP
jgi:NTE family protein